MKYVELKKHIENEGIQPIYLFEGEDCYFREHGEKMISDKCNVERTLDFSSFDGTTLKGDKIKELVSAVESFPFVSEKRVVKVSEFYPTESDFDSYLKTVFTNPPTTSVLMIFNSSKAKAGTYNFSKNKNTVVVDVGKADEETVKKWIYLTAKKQGVFVDGITCSKIASYCILDMARISKETEKLLSYCVSKGVERITDELVDELVYADSEYKLYELSNAWSRKNYSKFMEIMKDLSGKGYDEISLLNSLLYFFKGVYDVSVMKGSDKEIAEKTGQRDFVVQKNRTLAQKIGKKAVKNAYFALFDLVSKIKSGECTPQTALNLAVTKLFFEI